MIDLIVTYFDNYTLAISSIGVILIGAISGLVGTFTVLRKQSLLGDVLSHAMLPGLVIGFIFSGTKSNIYLTLGAVVAAYLAIVLFNIIIKKSKLKQDAAMAVILSVFFGFGILLLSYVQRNMSSSQSGIEEFIFGQAATMLRSDVDTIFYVFIFVFVIIALFWKELKLISFDNEFGRIQSYQVSFVEHILNLLLVISITVGLQAVGVVLMSALLVGPAIAARQYTDNLRIMAIFAVIFGSFSGFFGAYTSSNYDNLPTGPTIIVTLSIIVAISLLFAPKRGLLKRKYVEMQNKSKILVDAILADLYNLYLQHDDINKMHNIKVIKSMSLGHGGVESTLELLKNKKLVKNKANNWTLTLEGLEKAKELEAKLDSTSD